MSSEDWLKLIQDAKKTVILQDDCRKIHFLLKDNREMVEEYHIRTNVLTRRIWREKGKLGQNTSWIVEVGDPEPKAHENLDICGFRESPTTPFITRRNTKNALEWRIRNLPYPKDVYSVTAENDGTITVRTSNKKYFKKIIVQDLERLGLKPEQKNISFSHQFNTLIISYTKPSSLLEMENKILNEIMKIKARKEGDVQCPTS